MAFSSLSLLIKGAIGVVTLGTTTVGFLVLGGVFSKSDRKEGLVSNLIKVSNPDKRIISTKDIKDAYWKEAWKLYKEDNKGKNVNEDSWNLQGWSKNVDGIVSDEDLAINSLISECNSRLSKKAFGVLSDFYKEVLRYCTRDTLVSDLIFENNKNRSLLDTSLSDNDGGWQRAWWVYRQQNNKSGENQNTWNLEGWETKRSGTTLPNNFKTTCASKTKSKAFDLSNEDYKGVLAWCTK